MCRLSFSFLLILRFHLVGSPIPAKVRWHCCFIVPDHSSVFLSTAALVRSICATGIAPDAGRSRLRESEEILIDPVLVRRAHAVRRALINLKLRTVLGGDRVHVLLSISVFIP